MEGVPPQLGGAADIGLQLVRWVGYLCSV